MKKLLLPFVPLLPLMQSCVNSGLESYEVRPKTLPRSLTADEQTLIKSGNTFSFNIFRRVAADDAGWTRSILATRLQSALKIDDC